MRCTVYPFLEIIIFSKQISGFIKKYNSYLDVFNDIIPVDEPEKMIHFEEIIIKELTHSFGIEDDPTKRPSIEECLQQIKGMGKDDTK
jgi:hypothetical protein